MELMKNEICDVDKVVLREDTSDELWNLIKEFSNRKKVRDKYLELDKYI